MDACNIERNTYETSHRITAASGQKKQLSLITMLLNTHIYIYIYIYARQPCMYFTIV